MAKNVPGTIVASTRLIRLIKLIFHSRCNFSSATDSWTPQC